MAVSLIPVLIILAAVVLLVWGLIAVTRRQDARRQAAERPTSASLRYRVPEGQDPAAVLLALREAGYDAVTESDLVVVTVLADTAEERERVRDVIARAGVNIESAASPGNRVRFVDE